MIASPLFKKPSAPAAQPGYNRPGDWLALPDMSATEGVAILYAVGDHDANFCAFSAGGAQYSVNWGDGTTESYANGATALHNYAWSDISPTTLTSRGYRQAIITITPESGSFTSLNFKIKHPDAINNSSSKWLDVSINAPSATNTFGLFNSTTVIHRNIEQIRIYAWGGTSFSAFLGNATGLQSVPLFDTSNGTNFSNMFSGASLYSVPLFDTINGTNFSNMFQNCTYLHSVPLFDTSNGTNFSSMFNTCRSLETIPALDLSSGTNLSNMFSNCSSLARIKATGMKVSFSVASCSLSAAALDEIYNNLATVTGQTITVTGNYGTASDNPSIATAKGWTVTG